MRIIGLDVGDRTIGVAVSDLLGWTAQGVEVIRRKNTDLDFERLAELIDQYEVENVLIGWPKNMNGTIGPRCEKVQAFADEFKLRFPAQKIILWDERLSTVAAAKSLIAADVSRAKRKKVIDKMAAVFILQGYLDSHMR
ncbi:putative Holliday junction resolvase [Sporomusaceae bacterium BoRhaA]|uniref:Holliday junction resolvase RuvX n=1 Tax=Pelorhabdus rhamnosifermentans TaxID=2772457 RepID=UPI001C06409C|nr:Holliday junction resolvase RuvX [Pelorhabdus rhamnosifermentans]MBU2700919.1 putative Holliday junction resolvase [Pelorhabdus rhamnosifermentans]